MGVSDIPNGDGQLQPRVEAQPKPWETPSPIPGTLKGCDKLKLRVVVPGRFYGNRWTAKEHVPVGRMPLSTSPTGMDKRNPAMGVSYIPEGDGQLQPRVEAQPKPWETPSPIPGTLKGCDKTGQSYRRKAYSNDPDFHLEFPDGTINC
jgi:hypothetical protein